MTKPTLSTTLVLEPAGRAHSSKGRSGASRANDGATRASDGRGGDRAKAGVSGSSPGGGVSLAVDTFVGRNDDMRRIDELFDRGRLVTITGAPGMGKTRLATEMVRAGTHFDEGGIRLFLLASLADPNLVGTVLAAGFGLPGGSEDGVVERLAAHFGDTRLLLVLDNCEHLLDACAKVAAELVKVCPNLRILATSQERLGVAGEQVWPLSGLAVPNPFDLGDPASTATAAPAPGAVSLDPASAMAFPAVALFVQRAQAIRPRFDLDAANVVDVVDICRRLDGIPLAIELAAAWVKTLGPADIARRLDDRFVFLTRGDRAGEARHQTLRTAVDWSYDLLSRSQRELLRRLSVFAGGASLEAVEAVCSGGGVAPDDCLDLLDALVERSLVVTDNTTTDHAFGGVHGGAKPPRVSRFDLLETIRFYGRDRLVESGEASTTAARHLAWCLELAESCEPLLTGPAQRAALARLDAEHDNLRAAMAHALDQGPTEHALRLAGSLAVFWRLAGHFREGHDWSGRALAVSEGAPALLRARALWGRALMAAMLGHQVPAATDAEAGLALFEEAGDYSGVARSLLVLGSVGVESRSIDEEISILQRCIAVARREGDAWSLAQALAVCGSSLGQRGDPVSARPMLEESVAVARAAGDEHSLLYALIALGYVALSQGDFHGARAALSEALSATELEESGPAYERAMARIGLAQAASGQGDHLESDRLLGLAAADARGSGPCRMELELAATRGAFIRGDVGSAERSLLAARDLVRDMGVRSPPVLSGLGLVALARGDTAGAKTLLDEASRAAAAKGGLSDTARTLSASAALAAATRHPMQASSRHRQALALWHQIGDMAGLAGGLEAVGGIEVQAGRAERATRAFAAAQALRDANGCVRWALDETRYQSDLAVARSALGTEAFDRVWAEGSTSPVAGVVSSLSRGRRKRDTLPATGLEALTATEREVTRLLLTGNSNAEISAVLFVSVHTVKSHIGRIYNKLEVSSRVELRGRYSTDDL